MARVDEASLTREHSAEASGWASELNPKSPQHRARIGAERGISRFHDHLLPVERLRSGHAARR